jgi:hypothetical protein
VLYYFYVAFLYIQVRDLVGRELCAKSTAPFSYVPPVYRNAITSHNGSENVCLLFTHVDCETDLHTVYCQCKSVY